MQSTRVARARRNVDLSCNEERYYEVPLISRDEIFFIAKSYMLDHNEQKFKISN